MILIIAKEQNEGLVVFNTVNIILLVAFRGSRSYYCRLTYDNYTCYKVTLADPPGFARETTYIIERDRRPVL